MYFSSFGYSHYLHNEVFAPRGVQWIWLDVICQYWQWAKNKSTIFPESQAMAMKPALSVMHTKAHSWACEVCACLQCYSVCGIYSVFHRYYGVVDSKWVQVQEQVKIWSNYSHIYRV